MDGGSDLRSYLFCKMKDVPVIKYFFCLKEGIIYDN